MGGREGYLYEASCLQNYFSWCSVRKMVKRHCMVCDKVGGSSFYILQNHLPLQSERWRGQVLGMKALFMGCLWIIACMSVFVQVCLGLTE